MVQVCHGSGHFTEIHCVELQKLRILTEIFYVPCTLAILLFSAMCTLATLRLQQTTLTERGLASAPPGPDTLPKSGSLLLTLTKQEIISLSSKTSESLITLFTTRQPRERGVNLCVTHRHSTRKNRVLVILALYPT